jgi:hypothetical protein
MNRANGNKKRDSQCSEEQEKARTPSKLDKPMGLRNSAD